MLLQNNPNWTRQLLVDNVMFSAYHKSRKGLSNGSAIFSESTCILEVNLKYVKQNIHQSLHEKYFKWLSIPNRLQ